MRPALQISSIAHVSLFAAALLIAAAVVRVSPAAASAAIAILSLTLVALAAPCTPATRQFLYLLAGIGALLYVMQAPQSGAHLTMSMIWLAAVGVSEISAAAHASAKRGTEATQRAAHLLQTILDADPNLIFVKDRQSRLTLVNQAVRRLFGKSNAELVGFGDEALGCTAEEAAAFRQADQEVLTTRDPVQYPDQHIVDASGAQHWFQATKVALPVDNDTTHILVVAADVSDRIYAEARGKENERLLRSLTAAIAELLVNDDLSAAICTALRMIGEAIEVDRAIIFENQAPDAAGHVIAIQRFGWEQIHADSCMEAPPRQIAYFPHLQRWYELFQRRQPVVGSVEEMPAEEQTLLAGYQTLAVIALPIFVTERFWGFLEFDYRSQTALQHDQIAPVLETLAATLGAAIGRRATRQQLRRQEQMTSAILHALPDLIYVKDRAGRYITANPAHLALLGVSTVEEIVGKTDFAFFSHESTVPFFSEEQEIMRSDSPVLARVEVINVDTPEKRRWVLASKIPMHDTAGEVSGLIVISRDITELKETEAALRLAKEMAEEAMAAKSEFLANMSHELRTPLNAVIGMASLLDGTELSDEQKEYVSTVHIGSKILLTVIDDILDFSKIEAGRLEIESHPFHLVTLIEDIMRLLKLSAEQKSLALTTTIDSAVPVEVAGDAVRLRQVLVNLLNNAIKFTEKGEVRLEVRGEPLDGVQWRLIFAVHDTGIGIPTEARDRLFQPFSQVDASTTRRFGGTGLGLVISRRLVELMGGEIGAASIEGEGSTFHFSVVVSDASPRRERAASAPISADQPPSTASQPSSRAPLRILLAEDNVINQKVAARILQRLGYTATIVSNGLEALDAAKKTEYDVVLMDLHMPEMNGLDAARAIRRQLAAGRQPYIIALTADVGEESSAQCYAAGMDAVLFKPIEVNSLAEALHAVDASAPAMTESVSQEH